MALALFAAKGVSIGFFISSFPRTLYPLPGVEGPLELIQLVMRSLFWKPPAELASQVLANSQWSLGWHEWNFGVTPLPALVLLSLAALSLARRVRSGKSGRLPRKRNATWWVAAIGLTVLLLMPLAMNLYTPSWNALLKQLPVLGSSSNLFRWFAVYLPIAIVGSMVALQRAGLVKARGIQLPVIGTVFVVVWAFTADHENTASGKPTTRRRSRRRRPACARVNGSRESITLPYCEIAGAAKRSHAAATTA